MRSPSRTPLLLVLLVLLGCLAAPATSWALWPNSPLVNVPLSTAPFDQTNPQITTDGAGGAITVWQDARNGALGLDIYVRRVDNTGTPQWTLDGVPVCTVPGDQQDPVICSDGAGGAIMAWTDGRVAGTTQIYAQHVLSTGVIDPAWPPTGVPVCTAAGGQTIGGIHADGAGGAYIAWTDYRNNVDYRPDVYAQRINAGGAPMWIVDGMPVVMVPNPQEIPTNLYRNLVVDSFGALVVCWQDHHFADWDILAQRLDPLTGVQMWPPTGAIVCNAAGDQTSPTMIADLAGGTIITWQDARGGSPAIFAERMTAGGFPMWIPNGNQVCFGAWPQILPRIVNDGTGGAIIAWQDNRLSATFDLFAQRLTPLGAVAWGPIGQPVCTAPNDQLLTGMVSDGAGGALVTWADDRVAPGFDVYAQRMSPGGLEQWALDGVPISTAAGDQTNARLVNDGLGGAVIAWQDSRNSGTSGWDIYVQGVSPSGALAGVGSANPPGAPLAAGGTFSTRLRENFIYPPNHADTTEAPISVVLPGAVEPGFLVLLDDTTGTAADSSTWSDVIVFTPFDPAAGSSVSELISNPPERPFTDADFAPFGLSASAIRGGNTVYLRERIPATRYEADNSSIPVRGVYAIHSDVDTLPPGAPLAGAGFHVLIAEPPEGPLPEPYVTVPLPAVVMPGYVVVLEDSTGAEEDSTNWSDVISFGQAATGAPVAVMVSDADSIPTAPFHKGIDSSDLAGLGVTVLDVLESNTIYVHEVQPIGYLAPNPLIGAVGAYNIYSDLNTTAVPRPGRPLQLALHAPAPNPSAGATRVAFALPTAERVRLEVFDLAGRCVRTLVDGVLPAGEHASAWDGRADDGHALGAGLYLVRLEAGNARLTRRLAMLR